MTLGLFRARSDATRESASERAASNGLRGRGTQ
jgi:hypothetical protein